MDIWIIQDGEKVGPIHDFDVRKKIEAGELPAATPAWHDGLPAWKPLGEIGLFEREFDRPFEHREAHFTPPEERPEKIPDDVPPQPAEAYLWRRFWARWFDLYVYSGVWWLGIRAAGRDIGETLDNPWIILLHFIPWFVLEILLLHRFGTTPGKWLLGIRIVNKDGSLLGLTEATRRAVRVFFIGLGFGWMPLALICMVMAYFTTKRIGRPLWDHAGGHVPVASPLNPLRLVAYVFILFGSLLLQSLVFFPYMLEMAEKNDPTFKAKYEALRAEFQRNSGDPPAKP